MVYIKSNKEIEFIKESCLIVAKAHEEIKKAIKPGISTLSLDKIAQDVILSLGAVPSFKNYPSGFKDVKPFPASSCISINDEVIHGIPSKKRIINNGDIVGIDIGAYKNGFHGDSARTHIIGEVDEMTRKLVEVTKQSFFEGIKFAKPGLRIGDISNAIGEFVHKNGFSVVREFQGHGIGRNLHEDPGIPNYGTKGKGIRLEAGMTLAIEPMVNIGVYEIEIQEDGWTTLTKDGSNSAHYENTILITDNGAEILTKL